ncbi:MAG: NAD(P)H-dependent oxidoreductase [Thiotrichales bacterium]|nr:NAD(P)H-dependent oxidoreductase [Thiotrichales bacterium]
MPLEQASDRQMLQVLLAAVDDSAGHEIVSVDLYADPPPYYDARVFNFLWRPISEPGYQPDAAEQEAAGYLLRHCELFRSADFLVLSIPVWNSSIPAILKAWIDFIIAPNQTYRFGPDGIEALHRIQGLLLLVSSGGLRDKVNSDDHFLAIHTAPFRYIGIQDIDVIWADGQEPKLFEDQQQRLQRAITETGQYAQRLVSAGK